MIRAAATATITAAALLAPATGCKVKDPPAIDEEWTDDFDRDEIGSNYYRSGGNYSIEDGVLVAKEGYNHPLWLRKKLPDEAEIELDVWAATSVGDIKVEAWGDGKSHAKNRGAYTATGYVFIFGGWKNTKSILARKDEHGGQMSVDQTRRKVEPNQKYHWKLVRKQGTLEWYIDGDLFLRYEDSDPLTGKGHSYFGFNNWEAETRFDNLVVRPL